MSPPLRAPFPYFGGKSKIAADVWARLGRPKQYVEPFCGSAAMLLAAPAVSAATTGPPEKPSVTPSPSTVSSQPACFLTTLAGS